MSKFFETEFAPGIPQRGMAVAIPTINKVQQWEFVVQEHNALRRKHHFDFRLAPPGGPGFSWVLNELPGPGQQTPAIRTYDHEADYFDFKGTIKSGYGAGTVSTVLRGSVDVLHTTPNKITFYWYGNSGTEVTKYTLISPYGDPVKWILMNHTTTIALNRQKRIESLKYKDLSGNYKKEFGDFETPKIDGASSIVILLGNKTPVVYSRGVSQKTGMQIEYTPKIPKLLEMKVPKDFGTTVLRAEVFGVDQNGAELPNRTLGGILNSSVQKSRAIQKISGSPLRLAGYDVVKYKGRNVSKLPIEERYKILEEINKKFPIIENPVALGKIIPFTEGKVVWRNGVPLKVKNKADYDVFVKNIFPSIIPNRAGGFEYSLYPGGPTVGKVGTGFTHEELIDMMTNKRNYIGRVAKVNALEQYPSGALRGASFNDWHLEKNF